MKNTEQNPQVFKKLLYLLRQGALREGLNMNSDGYVSLKDILKLDFFKKKEITNDILLSSLSSKDMGLFETQELIVEMAKKILL